MLFYKLPKTANVNPFLFKKTRLEDVQLIRATEAILKSKRGYVYKIPNQLEPVIVLMSGGLDTCIMTGILLDEYKLNVYPLFLNRGQIRVKKEIKAAKIFIKEYKKRYPSLMHDLKIMNAYIPPYEIRWPLTSISNELVDNKSKRRKGLPVYTALLANYAVQYSYYLGITQGLDIKNIFCGFMKEEGEYMIYETLTALRLVNLQICALTGDYSWQLTSLALEKELGFFLGKYHFIKWGTDHKLPLEKSWSCYHGYSYQCGNCEGCWLRQDSFKKARRIDSTIYKKPNKTELFIYEKYKKIYEKTRGFNF